jgi:hypothetical protein
LEPAICHWLVAAAFAQLGYSPRAVSAGFLTRLLCDVAISQQNPPSEFAAEADIGGVLVAAAVAVATDDVERHAGVEA